MMKNLRRVTGSLVIPALLVTMWWSAGKSQDELSKPGSKPAAAVTASRADSKAGRQMPSEEKLVRDAYARLMRYQSAAVDELSTLAGKTAVPDDYLTVTVRGVRSGDLANILERAAAEFIDDSRGETISLNPVHLGDKEGATHAYYEAAWSAPAKSEKSRGLIEDLPGIANFERYVSYVVRIQFQGRTTSYRALAFTQRNESKRPAALFFDNAVVGMNELYEDESARVQSPWSKYVKSSLFQAVRRTINATREAGGQLIPPGSPIGYLPGDGVSPNDQDARTMAMNVVCPDLIILRDGNPITNTTQSAIAGERINLSVEGAGGDEPELVEWTIGGNRIANFEVNGTGPTGPSTGTVTALTNLTDSSLSYYWTNGGQQVDVSVTATVFGTQITKSARFNVVGPNTTGPTVTLETNGQLNVNSIGDCNGNPPFPAMVFGSISGPNPGTCVYSGQAGIRFVPPGASGPAGNFFFVQLITAENVTYSHNLGTSTCTGSVAGGLDQDYPYQRRTGLSVSDAPFTPLPSTYLVVSRTFGATMYLMWQSKNRNSIPVPIGSVAWGFTGSTTQQRAHSNIWTAPTGSGSAQAFVPASGPNSYPVWSALHSTTCH